MAPGEQLRARQWMGVALAFLGLFLGFAEGFGSAGGTLLGDAFGVIAAVLWSATTVVVRASRLARVSATKTLESVAKFPLGFIPRGAGLVVRDQKLG